MVELMSTRLTTWADEIVNKMRILKKKNDRSSCVSVSISCFEWWYKGMIVDIHERTYSCRVFQLD